MVCTRSQKQQLTYFDPEIERTARQRRREQNLQWEPSLQGTVLHTLFTGDLDSKEGMAFVLPTAGQPLRESLAAHATEVPSCITYPEVEDGSTFEITASYVGDFTFFPWFINR